MADALINAAGIVIVGVLSLLGTRAGAKAGAEKAAALMSYRMNQLETKVDKHNNAIERIYCVEKRLDVDDEKHRVINHRLDDLEKGA